MGEQCTWGNRRLGKFLTEQECRDRITNHLAGSDKHQLTDVEVQDLALAAVLETEGWPLEDEQEGKGNQQRGGQGNQQQRGGQGNQQRGGQQGNQQQKGGWWQDKGKGKDKGKQQQRGSHGRSEPYSMTASDIVAVVRDAVRDAVQPPSSSSPTVATVYPQVHPFDRVAAAVARSEAAARTAARMARQAAQAFEEEAHVLRDCLNTLREHMGQQEE